MRFTPAPPPPPHVVDAFGASGVPELLPGGESRTYRCGEITIKVWDDDTSVLELERQIAGTEAFRYSQPILSTRGHLVEEGWCARPYVAGQHERGRFAEQICTCIAFHEAVATVPRPDFLGTIDRSNAWSIADHVTWGELEIDHHEQVAPLVARLRDVMRPVESPFQLIHGDFGHNLLFADGLPPAVIDFSPYWRPAAFALGVVVADAIAWEDAPPELIDEVTGVDEWLQQLARAELRRILEVDAHLTFGRDMLSDLTAHARVVEAICERMT